MKVHLNNWNQRSLLWRINTSDNFWAGEYVLAHSTQAREKFLQHHTHHIDTILRGYPQGSSAFLAYLKQRFITFEEYQMLIENKSFPKDGINHSLFAPIYWELINKPKYKLLLPYSDDHEKNYLGLLKKWLPRTSEFFFSPMPVPVAISDLQRHLLITGKTGSGKSEFLKHLFYQLQHNSHQKQNSSMVLLDPHGDISEQLFTLRLNIQNPSRLWYIDAQLDSEKIPCLNPFWSKVKNTALVDILSQQWAKAFSELIPEAGMSLQMEAILKPCLAVMFQRGECGLFDLQIFMDDTQNEQWVELGRKSSHPVYRMFFEQAFLNKKYAPTKLAIYTRLQMLLNNYTFYNLMNGECTVDFKKGMQLGKVMLLNLSKGRLGEDCSKALGRFVSATLLSLALQRANVSERSRKHCYLFVDEFHNLASSSMETVFSEARKYHLHLIVGTQSIGQLSVSLKNMVLNNTAVKLVGINGLPALKSQASDIGVPFGELQRLEPYHFFLKNDHHPALKIKSPDFMLKNPKRYFGTDKEIDFLKQYMIEKSGLYRDRISDSSSSRSKASDQDDQSPNDFTPEFEL